MPNAEKPLVGIIMGSESDWEPAMQHASAMLDRLAVPHEKRVISAHRTPTWVEEYAASARERGIKVIIAGAGGAAHLPGMTAAQTDFVPVIGVPIETSDLKGMDSLLSIVQMPPGVPVGTMAIGKKGAVNAAVYAAEILADTHPEILDALRRYRSELVASVTAMDGKISAQ